MGCVRGPDSWCPVPCHTQGRQLLGGFPLGVWGQVLSQPCVGHTSPLASLTSNPREVNPSPGISSVNLPVLWGSPSPWESSHGCCPCRGQDGKGGWMPTPWSRWLGGTALLVPTRGAACLFLSGLRGNFQQLCVLPLGFDLRETATSSPLVPSSLQEHRPHHWSPFLVVGL